MSRAAQARGEGKNVLNLDALHGAAVTQIRSDLHRLEKRPSPHEEARATPDADELTHDPDFDFSRLSSSPHSGSPKLLTAQRAAHGDRELVRIGRAARASRRTRAELFATPFRRRWRRSRSS